MAELFVPISFFVTVFGIIYLSVSSRHRERMAMIERGMEPVRRSGKRTAAAFLIMGIPLGLFIGYFLIAMSNIPEELAYIGMAMFFGGLGLFVGGNLEAKEEASNKMMDHQ